MKLTVTQAAEAVNKSRKTLYRHMNSGKLSYEDDMLGNRVIDVSELQRVYSGVDVESYKDDTTSVSSTSVSMSQTATHELELLKVKLEAAERQLELEREEKQRLFGIIESQAMSMKQLLPPKDEKKKGFWARLFGG